MAKVIMIQGTMSNAGKSLLCAGLCRIFRQDGYRVAPFKSQNMALNSYITEEGLEMGRAQVMQAEAAGIRPSVDMNPILLKPTNDIGSQVIVNGEVVGNFSAGEYFARKKELIPDILRAFRRLEEQADIIVIEGAGSPAEINLKENDIVNMGMAKLVDAPVLLVGDIDRGGVFAQLLGTLMLLDEEERARVKGLVINKFRGDKSILDPGVRMLEERGGIPVTGVIPYMELSLEDEDSLTERFHRREAKMIDLAVIRYPRISNFTDFDVFEQAEGVSLRYVRSVAELGHPDMIFLPGSKNTMEDLRWMRECGLEAAVKKRAGRTVIFGICGGYQMLGKCISDPYEVEQGGSMRGMELLAVETVLERQKTRRTVSGNIGQMEGILANLSGQEVEGYELHMGCTRYPDGGECPMVVCQEEVYGSYVHGIFDKNDMASRLLQALAERKGALLDTGGMMDYRAYKETQYDKLADGLREHLELDKVYGMLREAKI
jgi:adenosylcobyric acid synthase